jgi:RHS repeat-associated protein
MTAALPAVPSGAQEPDPDGGPGGRDEVVAQRTATSKTYLREDGSFTTTVFSAPVHFLGRDGRWKEIDGELVASDAKGYAWENAANEFRAQFKDRLEEDYLRFSVAGQPFSLSLEGATGAPAQPGSRPTQGRPSATPSAAPQTAAPGSAAPETPGPGPSGEESPAPEAPAEDETSPAEAPAGETPGPAASPETREEQAPAAQPDGPPGASKGAGRSNRVSYESVFDGVDLRYEVVPTGVKETLVLDDAFARTDYRFRLSTPRGPRVDAVEQPDGSWALTMDPFAEPLLYLGAPYATDSSGELSDTPTASMDVRRVAGDLVLDLRINRNWLRDPEREFPVFLDPTMTIQPDSEDASFSAGCTGCTPVTYDRLYMGTSDTSAWRAALQFNLAGVPADAVVTDANLGLYYDRWCISSSTSCWNVTQQIDAHRMTKAWTTSTQSGGLGFDPAVEASYTLDGTRSAHWMGWNVTGAVRSWLTGTQPNYGLLMKRSTEPLGAGGPVPPGRRFAEPSVMPRLTITYTSDAVDLKTPATLHSDGADLEWTRYTGPSGSPFVKYEVHRSKAAIFTPSASTLLTTIRDASITKYRDTTAAPNATFTYRIVANSSASNPQTVTLPADGNASKLLQPGAEGKQTYAYYSTQLTNCANYGAEQRMWVGASSTTVKRPLVEFDLRDIPSGATISSARLSLWHSGSIANAATINAHRVTSSWQEGTGLTQCTDDGATWYDRQGGMKWTNPGADFAATPEGSVTNAAGEGAGWDDFDITPMVQKWVGGAAPNLGVLLKRSDEALVDGRDFSYYSDDFATTPTLRPKLAVSYSDGSHADGPVVSVTAPAGGAKVSGKTVKVAATATDDRRVETVELFVDGSRIATDSSAPFEASWDSTLVTNGAHSLTAKATDDAGNVTTSAAVGVTVENSAPPTVSVTSPLGGSSQKGTVAVAANANDDLGVSRVEFYFDDFRFGEDSAAPYTASWDTLDPAQPAYDGSHVLTAKAFDTHGQVTTSAPVTVTVANAAGTKYLAGWSSTLVPQAMTYDPAAVTQQTHGVDVTVANNSAVTWNSTDVVLRYRWMRSDGTVASTSADVLLGSNVMRGKSVVRRVNVAPPPLGDGVDKAQYVLRFDLYDKPTAAYFAAKGNKPLESPVVVNKAIRATALGLEKYYQYEGEEAGAGMGHLSNVASGNSLLRWTPFSSPGRGLSTVADITYNSLEDRSESPIGNNFSLSISSLTRFGLPLDVHPNKADEISGRSNKWIELTDGDGTTHRFEGKTAGDGTTYWEEPAGVHLYLREHSSTDPARKWALTRPDRVTFFYDSEGYPTSVEDTNGNRISFTLEATPPGEDPGGPKKRITKITDAAGQGATPAPNRSYTIDYYSKAEAKKAHVRGRIRSITDHNGSALVFDYYDDGNLLRMTQKGGANADGTALADRTFVFTYTTSDGAAAAIPDAAARANPEPKTMNQSTRLFSVRDPRGAETTFTYYGPTSGQLRWKLKSRTDRGGQTTSYAYDIANRVTTVTAPMSRASSYRYDTEGKIVAITNPKNETTQLSWSADRHVTKVTEPTGAFMEYAYNANGYVTDVWDQLRNRTSFGYENLSVDAKDVTGRWKTGRAIPHLSQLKSKTAPKGTATATPVDDYQWTFDYDTKGNLLRALEPEGSPRFTTSYTYNADGLLASTTDANNKVTTFNSYDANGLPSKLTDAESQVTQFGYDDDGLLRWVQDPNHASYTGGNPRAYRSYFDYDSFHRLGRQSAPKLSAGNEPLIWSAAELDPNDNVVAQFAPAYGHDFVKGVRTSTTYDAMDRRRTSTNPEGHVTDWAYDAAGRLTRVTSPKGVETTGTDNDHALFVEYDPLDRVLRQTRYDTGPATPKALTTHFCYDLAGDLVSVTAPKAEVATVGCTAPPGFTTKFTYDAAHRTKTATDPLGHKRSVTYDANGNIDTETDADSTLTTTIYDQRNLPVRQEVPFTSTRKVITRTEYDGVGNVLRRISPRAHDLGLATMATTYTYDGVNRLVRIALPYKGTETPSFIHRDYDDSGNLTKTTLADPAATLSGVPQDKVTEMTVFDPGWIKTSDDHVSPKVTFDYRAEGLQTSRTPLGGSTELWSYYDDGLLKEHKDRAGHPVEYFYDPNDNLTKAIDRSGLFKAGQKPIDMRATYDTLDRVTKVRNRKDGDTSTDFKFSTFSYDLNGNVVERADDGVETEGGTQVTAPKRHTFTYDAADWLTAQQDYLKDGCQKIDNTFTNNGWEASRVVRKSALSCDDPAATFTARQSTEWVHFLNGKLKKLTTRKGDLASTIVEQHDVDYLADGAYVNGHRTKDVFFRTSPDATMLCGSAAAPCTATYTYDGRDRLVREDKGHGPATDYTLDSTGNITKKVTGASSLFYKYQGSQLRTVASGSETNVGARYFYDTLGNVDCVTNGGFSGTSCSGAGTSSLLKDYAYDPLERLEATTTYSGGSATDTAQYTYDALDRVVSETERHGIGGTAPTTRTTSFSHLGLSNLVTREDMTGDSKSASKTYSYDAYGHRISMTDDPKDQTKPDETYTYGYDVHGSVSMLLDKSGTVKASYGYTAYGEKDDRLTSEGLGYDDKDPLNAYRYTSKRFDSGSGTLDMGARRFAPDTARFLQDDMYGGALANLALSFDPLTQNRYSLAGGNPVSFVEVDGHMVIADGGGGGSTSPNPDDGGTTSDDGDDGPLDGWVKTGIEAGENVADVLNVAGGTLSGAARTQVSGYYRRGHWVNGPSGQYWRRGHYVSSHTRSNPTSVRWATTSKWAGRAGPALAYGGSFASRWWEDSDRTDLSTTEKVGRATASSAFMGTASTAGGLAGAKAGAAVGAAIGSVIPGAGTAVGGLIGGIAGALGGSFIASKAVEGWEDDVAEWGGGVAEDVGDFFSDLF